MKAESDEPP